MLTNNKISHETTAINKSVASYKIVYNKFVTMIGAKLSYFLKETEQKTGNFVKISQISHKIANSAEFAENANFCNILRETANFAADLKFCDFACDFANANFWGL